MTIRQNKNRTFSQLVLKHIVFYKERKECKLNFILNILFFYNKKQWVSDLRAGCINLWSYIYKKNELNFNSFFVNLKVYGH